MINFIIPLMRKMSVPITGTEWEESTQHNVSRVLEKEFNYADWLGRTNTDVGVMQDTPGEGTSIVGDPALQLLHRLWQSSLELANEITKLQ